MRSSRIQEGCASTAQPHRTHAERTRARNWRRPGEGVGGDLRLVTSGHREIVLTGIHIASYG